MPENKRRSKDRRSRHAPGRDRSSSGPIPGIKSRTIRNWRRTALYAGFLTIAILVIGSFVLSSFVGSSGGGGGSSGGTGDAIGEQVILLPAIHIPEGASFTRYNSVPPTSGSHWVTGWARCGIYDDADEVPDERIVHNMEHGQVIISYNLTDEAEIDRLKDIAKDLPSRRSWMIMRPYSQIPAGNVAITSWGWIQSFDGVDEAGIRDFYGAHFNQGLESRSCIAG